MRILLIANYAPDRQESMLRFADLLERGLLDRGHDVVTTHPRASIGRHVTSRSRLSKWAGYVDKFIIFPLELRRRSRAFDVTHVCDHSNALYRRWSQSRTVTATCHDLLAVRGALGEQTYCPASRMGRRLQASILRNLEAIPSVACDSEATRMDFTRLTGRRAGLSLRTIRLSFSPAFGHREDLEIQNSLAALGLAGVDYVLHTGSSQARKNREGILNAVAKLGSRWNGLIVFAGEHLRPEQQQLAANLGLGDRVREMGRLSDSELAALYSGARAFVFPSFCEGFGWPVLEAQACGCPVITANNTSLGEVAGDGALIVQAEDTESIGEAILKMGNRQTREYYVARGQANLTRFTFDRMLNDYEAFFLEALNHAA